MNTKNYEINSLRIIKYFTVYVMVKGNNLLVSKPDTWNYGCTVSSLLYIFLINCIGYIQYHWLYMQWIVCLDMLQKKNYQKYYKTASFRWKNGLSLITNLVAFHSVLHHLPTCVWLIITVGRASIFSFWAGGAPEPSNWFNSWKTTTEYKGHSGLFENEIDNQQLFVVCYMTRSTTCPN